MFFFSREREKESQRMELWVKVENLAAKKPEYEVIKAKNPETNNMLTSPDGDEEVNLENLEQQATEVRTKTLKLKTVLIIPQFSKSNE